MYKSMYVWTYSRTYKTLYNIHYSKIMKGYTITVRMKWKIYYNIER